MAFNRDELKSALADLAKRGIYLGTSSWKYPGWLGVLYDHDRYLTRGKFARTRFERDCLAEYAEVFKTVCVDAGYYRFPEGRYLEKLVAQVPADFLFSFKVTDEITVKKFPNFARFGERAGKINEHFLDAGLFAAGFLKPMEPFKRNVGMLIFEFSKFYPADYQHGRDFAADLDRFLGQLPQGWSYGVEMRNRNFLQPDYFAMLARHGVAHIYNSWDDMPPVEEQIELPGSLTSTKAIGARLLTRPGVKFEASIDRFSPYNEIKEAYVEVRIGAARLLLKARSSGIHLSFIYVNNRLEGNAVLTIAGIIDYLKEMGDA
jgi:uncharacterized protein YecE (DUF72 family)